MAVNGFSIGTVARRAGTNPKTIRYYEMVGLLPKPERGENRYRLYSEEAVELLQFIKKAQGLGLTLSEIREIVEFRRLGREPCVHVRTLLGRKIAQLDQRLKDMITLRKKLNRLLVGWTASMKRGKTRAVVCPRIEGAPFEPGPRG